MSDTTTATAPKTCEDCKKPLRARSQYDYKCKACELKSDLDWLRQYCPPGSTVYTNLIRVSRSGMSRVISLHVVDPKDGQIINISGRAARAMNDSWDNKTGGIKVSGCGMDVGFHLVYNLARTLYRDGFTCAGKLKNRSMCPSNDHSNGDRNYRKHKHSDGGYALNHRWI